MKHEMKSEAVQLIANLIKMVEDSILLPPALVALLDNYDPSAREVLISMYKSKLAAVINRSKLQDVFDSGKLHPDKQLEAELAMKVVNEQASFDGQDMMLDMMLYIKEQHKEESAPV